jgi:hypothetical protein
MVRTGADRPWKHRVRHVGGRLCRGSGGAGAGDGRVGLGRRARSGDEGGSGDCPVCGDCDGCRAENQARCRLDDQAGAGQDAG